MTQATMAPLEFTDGPADEAFTFTWSDPDEPYLTRLRTAYHLDAAVAGLRHDYERVRAVSAWVRGRWEHDGDNEPHRSDPLSILREAEQGRRFRCVEYGIVLAGALTALGIPARIVGLKTADCETRPRGAGHVVAETYLRDRRQWVLIDGQWGAIPLAGDRPLNAVEFQRALARAAPGLRVEAFSPPQAEEYFAWIAPHLFYFDVTLDNRFGDGRPGRAEEGHLLLVPAGAKEPRVFQRRWPLQHYNYTRSLSVFYPTPP